ncbi:hypothetical protein FB45DRAFT_997655 [Roridomyces roridus]|uniref:Uncharacterized protein n=1 Tax=Roridomyces roridus TaxID=1738132 RepID=A0AAD7CKI5_9AGAR|nr:hypothetical protein FB45DRAFT_997655 [Roridomyces roridus]
MPLSDSQIQLAHDIAQRVFQLEDLAETHRVFIANNVDLASFQADLAANPPEVIPLSTDESIDRAEEEMLAFPSTNTDIRERYRAMTNCMGVTMKRLQLLAAQDYAAYEEALRFRTELHVKNSPSGPEASQPAFQPQPEIRNEIEAPGEINSPGFSSASVSDYSSSPVSPDALSQFLQNPETLLGRIFIIENDGETEIIRFCGRVVTPSSRSFYVEWADAGPVAWISPEEFLDDMFKDAKEIQVPQGVSV